ncbi:MAG: 3',5'-cyclic-nucleotide phosphodiesterase [Mariprofundus sp.]|nr:3',5'-cyclic-nucleotide phosphodiesterase [Mariprofundus sp.]
MQVKVLGCYGGQLLGFHLTSFLINESILLDAGSPTEALSLEEQHKIRHICISHTHLDHIQDIAFLSDNRSLKRLGASVACRTITIHALPENNRVIKEHLLNNVIWPDFTAIPNSDDPTLALVDFEPEQPILLDGITITPIRVNHPVPCTGFLVDDGHSQLLYSADTGNTDRIWEIANAQPNLKAVILDCSFPNAYQHLADLSGHLTPQGVKQNLQKLTLLGKIPIYLYHMKPETLSLLRGEVEALDIPHLHLLTQVDELLL